MFGKFVRQHVKKLSIIMVLQALQDVMNP